MQLSHPFKALLAAATLTVAPSSQATIVFSGDFTNGTGQIEITEAIDFTLASNGFPTFLIFDELLSTPPTLKYQDGSVAGTLNFTLEGSDSTESISAFRDGPTLEIGAWTANDAMLQFGTVFAAPGQAFTLRPSTFTGIGGANFNAGLNAVGSFEGNVFLTSITASLESDVVFIEGAAGVPVVPGIALFGLGLLGLARVARRR